MGSSKNRTRKRKRKFIDNQHGDKTTTDGNPGIQLLEQCSSTKKKRRLRRPDDNTLDTNFFFFMDYSIFKNLINIIGTCPGCNTKKIIY